MSEACPGETIRQSEYSPGVVGDDETIVYVLFDPEQWQDGQLSVGAFTNEDLKKTRLSVARREYTTEAVAKAQVVGPRVAGGQKFVGGLRAKCVELRRLSSEDGSRLFCVLDDGLPGHPGHAVIGYSEAKRDQYFAQRNPKSDRVAIRQKLAVAFGVTPLSLSDSFR